MPYSPSLDAVICSRLAEGCTCFLAVSSFSLASALRFSCPLSFAFCGGIQALVFSTDAAFRSRMTPQNRSSSLKFSSRTALCSSAVTPVGRGCEIASPDRRPFCAPSPASTVTGVGVVPARGVGARAKFSDGSAFHEAATQSPLRRLSCAKCRDLAVIQPPFIRTGDSYGCLETEKGHGMIQGMSRRKALSLLGLGAALGFTLSSALAPSEAEAQEAATPPAAPAEATGTHGMNRRQSRRTGRHERRHGRHERRHTRRTGEKPAAAAPAEGAPAGTAPAPQ